MSMSDPSVYKPPINVPIQIGSQPKDQNKGNRTYGTQGGNSQSIFSDEYGSKSILQNGYNSYATTAVEPQSVFSNVYNSGTANTSHSYNIYNPLVSATQPITGTASSATTPPPSTTIDDSQVRAAREQVTESSSEMAKKLDDNQSFDDKGYNTAFLSMTTSSNIQNQNQNQNKATRVLTDEGSKIDASQYVTTTKTAETTFVNDTSNEDEDSLGMSVDVGTGNGNSKPEDWGQQ